MTLVANTTKLRAASALFDWTAGTIMALILDDSQATDPDRDFVSELSGELSGTGYSRQTLANRTRFRDDARDLIVCSADTVTWLGINAGLADRMVLFEDAATDAERRIISYHNFRDSAGDPIMTNGGDLTMPPSFDYGFLTVQ